MHGDDGAHVASRHGWSLDKASVEVRHVKVVSADGATQTDRFERIIDLEGDLTDEQRANLVEIANKCPVSQTLQRSSTIVTSLAKESQLASEHAVRD